jgi:hypothetical protein
VAVSCRLFEASKRLPVVPARERLYSDDPEGYDRRVRAQGLSRRVLVRSRQTCEDAPAMFLNYFSLAILLGGLIVVFYTFIYIHDIPYDIAKHRNHPQKEAIHVAGWLSLFTLHAIWPIVFIWAVSKQGPVNVAVTGEGPTDPDSKRRLTELEEKLRELEKQFADSSRKPGKS